jgi:hypothetical protein
MAYEPHTTPEELTRRYKAGEFKGMSEEEIATKIGWSSTGFIGAWIKRADCEHDYFHTGMTPPDGGTYYHYRECRKCGDVKDIVAN